jgi:hypothetical protein
MYLIYDQDLKYVYLIISKGVQNGKFTYQWKL